MELEDQIEAEDAFKRKEYRQKTKFISMFHYEEWRVPLSEHLKILSEKHKDERKKIIPQNSSLITRDERDTIIKKIKLQLVELGLYAKQWLEEMHKKHTEKTGELLDSNHSTDAFILCEGTPESKNERQKMVVVLANPSLSQIEASQIDPNPSFSNGLFRIEDNIKKYPNKTFSFVFSVPFFLGADTIKQDIVSAPGVFRPILPYTKDLMRVLNPSCMLAVTALAFERCLNKFEEKSSRETLRNKTSLFYSHLNDSLKGECDVQLALDKKIKCYYAPHPFSLTVKDAKPKLQEDWDSTWRLIDDLWAAKSSDLNTFVNLSTNVENKDASDLMKNEASLFYQKKIKRNKDPVRKLPKGKRISVGMDKFIVKKTIEKKE
jgi:hypothetical protein